MKPEKMSEDDIQNAVRAAITAAKDFVESEVAEERIDAHRYFNGEVKLETEENRSKVVATKCRDVVRMVKPVLMRTFLQSGTPVEFVPVGQDDIKSAEQATRYVEWKFNENNGFRVLSDVFHDALVKKTGIAKVWWEETDEVEFDEYSNLTPEAEALVEAAPDVELLEVERNEDGTVNLKVSKTHTKGRLKVGSIAPEDFFIDEGATSIDDFFVCGDTADMRVGDLVEMGFDFDEVFDLAGRDDDTIDEEEDFIRRGHDSDQDDAINDPSMRPIKVTEAYMRMDIEGTGVPKLYQFLCAGTNHKMLDYELADDVPYSVFEVDPEPHTFFGRSLVELVADDQDAATSLLRGMLDNVHMTNNPRLVVNVQTGNIGDAQNSEIGAVLREKGPGAYTPLVIPSQSSALLPVLQFYDESIEDKAGVSKASLGMDANALQSTTAAGVNAAIQAGSAQAELMARNLAEGGMRRLFKLMMKLTRQHAPADEMMRLNGEFVPVDPQSWNASMDLISNVGLGTGQKEERIAALMFTHQDQSAIWQAYGPNQPMVTMTAMYNTRRELLALQGIHDVTSYYNTITPEIEQQWQQFQAMQAAQQQPQVDPYVMGKRIEAQTQQQKAAMDAQAKREQTQANYMRDMTKAAADDDFRRDKMEQDRNLAAVKMVGEYGLKVDEQAIKREQAMPRNYGQ